MMVLPINQKEIQRRTKRLATFEDGLWDMLTGAVFFMLGIFPITRQFLGPGLNLVLFLVVMLVLIGLQLLARRIYSEPRLGVVKMRWSLSKTILVTVTFLLVVFSLIITFFFLPKSTPARNPFTGMPGWLSKFGVDLAAAMIVMAVYNIMGFLFRVPRLFLYGWMLGLGSLSSAIWPTWFGITVNLPLALAALIIFLTGVVLFIRFIRKYSLPPTDLDVGHD